MDFAVNELRRKGNRQFDCLIAIGGGSAIDFTKGIATLLKNSGKKSFRLKIVDIIIIVVFIVIAVVVLVNVNYSGTIPLTQPSRLQIMKIVEVSVFVVIIFLQLLLSL